MNSDELQRLLQISNNVAIPLPEIEFEAIRSQGAGGQNVNKLNSAIHLSFDINASSLPAIYKQRLLALKDQRITQSGRLIIKAQQHRTQLRNRIDSIERLVELVRSAMVVKKKRVATKPSRAAKRKRTDSKVKRGQLKAGRGKVKV